MAILTGEDLDAVRQPFTREQVGGVPWKRSRLNAAVQAIEDVFSSAAVQNALSNAIDTAMSPVVLNNAEKRRLVKFYLRNRFDRGN